MVGPNYSIQLRCNKPPLTWGNDTDGRMASMKEQWGSINPTFYRCWDYDLCCPRPCLTSIVQLPELPTSSRLAQNDPNPFNPSTCIGYTLPEEAFVRLSVFNLLGEQFEAIVNQRQRGAKYVALFDASKLAGGDYLYLLRAVEFTSVKKMVFIR